MPAAPLLFLDLYLTGGTYHASTCMYSSAQVREQPLYLARIERWNVTQELPDPLLSGGLAPRHASITLSDQPLEYLTAPTLSGILATENPKGKRARVRLYDPDTQGFGVTIEGYISGIGQDLKTLEIDGEDPALLLTELPQRRIFDYFPSAESINTTSRDPRVIVPFGPMPRVDLSLLHATYLLVTATMGGGGAQFAYYDLTHVPNVVVAAGDVLVYDVQWGNDDALIALELECGDGSTLRGDGATDQQDLNAHPNTPLPTGATAPNRKWYRREIPLPAGWVGKTIVKYLVACEQNTPGTYIGRIAKAFLLDVTGALKVIIHDENLPTITSVLDTRNSTASSLSIVRTAFWEYGPIRRPGGTGTAIVRAVYRDGRVLAPSEYSVLNFYDFTLARFTTDCRDYSGRRMRVQADLDSTEFARNPASVYEFLWSNVEDGLGQAVGSGSFASAASSYTASGLNFMAGGLSGAVPARKLFNDLSLRGEFFTLTPANEIQITVDTQGQHPLSAITLGQMDDLHRRNATLVNNTGLTRATTDQVKELQLLAYSDPGLDGNPTWLLSAKRSRAVGGKVEVIEKPYAGVWLMLDRAADYLAKLLFSFDTDIEVQVGSEAQPFVLGTRVQLTAPRYYLNQTELIVRRIEQEGNRFRLRQIGYDPALFTYTKGSVTVSPLVNTRIDYHLTPPATPTSFSFVSATLVQVGSHTESIEKYQAVLPAVNCSAMLLRAYRTGEGALFREVTRTPITPGALTQIEIQLPVGGSFNIDCHAVNGANHPDYRLSVAATLTAHLVAGDTTAPPQVTGLSANPAPPRGVKLRWTTLRPSVSDLACYQVQYENMADAIDFSAAFTARPDSHEFIVGNLINGDTYHFRVWAEDLTGNVGAYSSTVSLTVPRNGTDDLGDDIITTIKIRDANITNAKIENAAITTAKIQNAQIITAHIQDAQITNAKILDLSAVKITTGLLRVHPVLNGATAILVTGAGKVRLHAVSGTPSRLIFEDDSAVEQAEITGTTGGTIAFQPSVISSNQLHLGSTGRPWQALHLSADAIHINSPLNLNTGDLRAAPLVEPTIPPGTTPNRRLAIRNSSGAIICYLWAST